MEKTECKCDNGTPVEGVNCRDEGIQNCLRCDDSYNLQFVDNTASFWYDIPQLRNWAQTQKCVLNQCTCDRGYPSRECATNNEMRCDACHSTGDSLNEEKHCVPNICTCENGTEDVGHACEDNGFEDCYSCNSLFHQVSKASNASQWYQSTSHYLSEKSSCHQNICTCQNGQPVDGSKCVTHGDNKCESCNEATDIEAGYHLNSITANCDMNVCICEGGTPATACTEHESNEIGRAHV